MLVLAGGQAKDTCGSFQLCAGLKASYFNHMCLVLGLVLGYMTNSIHGLLRSSMAIDSGDLGSSNKGIIGIPSLI